MKVQDRIMPFSVCIKFSEIPSLIRRSASRSYPSYLAVFYLFVYGCAQFPRVKQGLNDMHHFRQTQTAWGVRDVIDNGLNFFHLKMPVLGYPYEVPMEFPLFQNFAGTLGSLLSLNASLASRLSSLIFFLGASFIVYRLTCLWANNLFGAAALGIFTLNPFSLQWATASLIESSAVFMLLLAVIAIESYFGNLNSPIKRILSIIIFAIATIFCALIKITTFFPAILPLLAFTMIRNKHKLSVFSVTLPAILLVLPLSLTYLWIVYSDQVKSANVATKLLTSNELRSWNLGTLEQRLSISNWGILLDRTSSFSANILFVALVLIVATRIRFYRIIFLIIAAVSPMLLYFNLYLVHDYYFMAVLPTFVMFIVYGISILFYDSGFSKRFINTSIITIASILLVSSFLTDLGRGYVNHLKLSSTDSTWINPLASEIGRATPSDSSIILYGCDWTPTLLYDANRFGYAVQGWGKGVKYEFDSYDREFLLKHYQYLIFCGDYTMQDIRKDLGLEKVSQNIYKLTF